MRFKMMLVLGSVLGFGLMGAAAQAGTITWGNSNYNYNKWSDARNWVGGILPTTGDTALITSGTPIVDITLSPAPDLIRLDSGATATFNTSNANNWVLNGGTFNAGGATVSGQILLTADSAIQNNLNNVNTWFVISGRISEDDTPRVLTFSGKTGMSTAVSGNNTYTGGTIVTGQVEAT